MFISLDEAILCRSCGQVLDTKLQLAETCSRVEACRGHYAVVNTRMDGAMLADTQARTEVRDLTDTKARPADIYMGGVMPGWKTAVDVCICSPLAHQSGKDAAEAAVRRKRRHYA